MPDKEKEILDGEDLTQEDLKDLEKVDGASEEIPEETETKEAEEADVKPEENEEDKTSEEKEEVVAEELPEEETKEKKSFFSRKKDKKTTELEEKVAELSDRYQRLMAEFDNYRKRTEKEKAAMFDNGTIRTIEKILPVVDNFERGLASVPAEDQDDQIFKGMDQIYKQLSKVLQDMGVEPIEALEKPFDLNLHNAVLQVPAEDESLSGTVAQELQKGYTYKGTVIRHSMVSVFE